MEKIKILWADDEIDLLKIHILFLQEKGYDVTTATNGDDAIDFVKEKYFDLIFLDENMPGLSGLETLEKIKTIYPSLPVVMVTKSEEEDIMDQAIGSKISDYLIKPVNPKQILLAIKKHVETKDLISKKTTTAYQTEFGKLGLQINNCRDINDWFDVYKKLVYWELELAETKQNGMEEVLKMQKNDANNSFARFIKNNYIGWFNGKDNRPIMSPNFFKDKVFPFIDNNVNVFVILIDNLRYDQWKVLQPIIQQYYMIDEENLICSILPTATQFARNAMFAGLMPSEIERLYPELWTDDDEEESKNQFEKELLQKQLNRYGYKTRMNYEKIMNMRAGTKLVENLSNMIGKELNVIVYNFIDMLSHARTEMDMIRELASDEAAYRSLTLSWFEHSSLLDLLKELAVKSPKTKVIITTDHGTIQVNNAVKVIGDRYTNTNLRFKQGKNLNYNPKDVFALTQPQKVYLPINNLSSTYIFACNNDFFAYPNNYNHYVKYYKNTFQHGGVSLEEMLIPCITLSPK